MTTNDGGADQYIGKPLSDCPDGTVAVVEDGDGDYQVAMLSLGTACYASLGTNAGYEHRDVCLKDKVVSIIKLGKPRPRTFADCEPGEVWQEPSGTMHWADDDGEMVYWGSDGIPSPNYPSTDQCWHIGPDWTRLGKITGIVIDGKVYGKEASDA